MPSAFLPSGRSYSALPLARRTLSEEIADAVRFILQAPAMTGQMIALDGGQHLGWAQRRRTDTPAPED